MWKYVDTCVLRRIAKLCILKAVLKIIDCGVFTWVCSVKSRTLLVIAEPRKGCILD